MRTNDNIYRQKQAICIQCHANPKLINRVIESFPEDKFDFFIHVDKKSDILPQIKQQKNVFFSKRIDVRWGQFSQVQATLSILNMIDTSKYHYIHLISGNDVPIKSPDYIWEKLKDCTDEYIESNELPGRSTWAWQGQDRYRVWYPQWLIQRPAKKMHRILRVAYREFVMRTKFLMRKKLPVSQFYGGSQWFSITGDLAGWMKNYLAEHEEYLHFFEHGVCSDEVFFATLARYSPYAKHIVRDCYRFMIWKGSNSGGPRELNESDIPIMRNDKGFFARKVMDIDTAEKMIRELCEKQKGN